MRGVHVRDIYSEQFWSTIYSDEAMLVQSPGGIDLNVNEKTLEE